MNATMTPCPAPDELAPLLADGAPEPPDLADHLAECPACRERLDALAVRGDTWVLTAAKTVRVVPPTMLMGVLRHTITFAPGGETVAQLETLDDPTLGGLVPAEGEDRKRIGPYEVLGVVGRGGMGVVLQAQDVVLRRTVALKIPAPAMRDDPVARGRFLREARAAASIAHPNVVPIHAVEEYAMVPVLVMAYVQGETLQERLDREDRLPTEKALAIALQVAQALDAAHERGLVHRDVKPANILLRSPDDAALLTDFGLARAADDARLTRTGLGAGTPMFMAPEQARGEAVDGRSDIFALGSVLFAMLAGRPPFATETLMGTLRRIADGPPDPLRTFAPDLPRHVEVLVMDLLSNDPKQRPATAGQVADRIRQCLQFLAEGIEPPPVRRRRRIAVAAGLMIAAGFAATGLAGVVFQFKTKDGGTVKVETDASAATVSYHEDTDEVNWETGEIKGKVKVGNRPGTIAETTDGKMTTKITNTPPAGSVARVAPATVTGTATVVIDGQGNVFRGRQAFPVPVPLAPAAPVAPVPVMPSMPGVPAQPFPPPPATEGTWTWQRQLPAPVEPGVPPAATQSRQRVEVREVRPRAVLTPGRIVTDEVELVPPTEAEIHGGGLIAPATAPGQTAPRFDARGQFTFTTAPRFQLKETQVYRGHTGPVRAIALTPDGKTLLSTSSWPAGDETVRVWDVESGKELHAMKGHKGDVPCVILTPDGKQAITGGQDGTIRFWDYTAGKEVRKIDAHDGKLVVALALSPDGKLLASGGENDAVELRDLETGKVVKAFKHDGRVRTVAFSPDGKTILSGDESPALRLLDIESGKTLWLRNLQNGWIEKVVFPAKAEGREFIGCDRLLFTGETTGQVNAKLFQNVHPSWMTDVAVSPDMKYIVTSSYDGRVRVLEVQPQRLVAEVKANAGTAQALLFGRDGKTLFVGGGGRYDLATKKYDGVDIGIRRFTLVRPAPVDEPKFFDAVPAEDAPKP